MLVRPELAIGLAPLANLAATCPRERPVPLRRFARNLLKYARGILASARFHMLCVTWYNPWLGIARRWAFGFIIFPKAADRAVDTKPQQSFIFSGTDLTGAECIVFSESSAAGVVSVD